MHDCFLVTNATGMTLLKVLLILSSTSDFHCFLSLSCLIQFKNQNFAGNSLYPAKCSRDLCLSTTVPWHHTKKEIWTIEASDARRITAAEMKHMGRRAGYTWTDYKRNAQIAKELKITPILDKLLEYKRSWIHINRMPRNRLPRVMKHYSPTGRRSHVRHFKRLLDTWESTCFGRSFCQSSGVQECTYIKQKDTIVCLLVGTRWKSMEFHLVPASKQTTVSRLT